MTILMLHHATHHPVPSYNDLTYSSVNQAGVHTSVKQVGFATPDTVVSHVKTFAFGLDSAPWLIRQDISLSAALDVWHTYIWF